MAKKSKRAKKIQAPESAARARADVTSVRWWVHVLVLIGLLLGNAVLYHSTFKLGFLSVDDPDYIQNNPYIESFHTDNLKHILTKPYAANYAPANLLSYSLDVALAKGKSAPAIHLSNVLWHGWVICAVYFLAFTIRPHVLTAAAAALLFLLHPAHVEVVAWISSRKDLIATGFAAISMACYLNYRREERGEGRKVEVESGKAATNPGSVDVPAGGSLQYETERVISYGVNLKCTGWYVASVLSFLFASAGKQSVLLLPAVMLVWDVLIERRRTWQMLVDKIPFGLIVVFFGWMTMLAQPPTRTPHNLFVMASAELTNLWLLTGFGKYVMYRNAPDSAAWSAWVRLGVITAAVLVWFAPLLFVWRRFTRQLNSPHPTFSLLLVVFCYYWILIQFLPPLVISFVVPITDRYLFLPSVGVCLLLAIVAGALAQKLIRAQSFVWSLLAGVSVLWGMQTLTYVREWSDPRSVWYGAHFKTKNSQVSQFLGEIYHNAGDRVNEFVKSGAALQITNDIEFAKAILGDAARIERLRVEWRGAAPNRTSSTAYRDELWTLAWDEYQDSVAHRGTLSAPNLYMNRGRLLVSEGKFEKAIPELQAALAFAQNSSYEVVRQETAVHAMRGIGVAYWSLRNYRLAKEWFLKAQEVQRKSGRAWIATLDQEVERVTALAAAQK